MPSAIPLASPTGVIVGVLTAAAGLALVGYAAWYALACWLAPFRRCRRCKGTGHRTSVGRSRSRSRTCGRCKGDRRRLRAGRRLWNWIRREYADANPSHSINDQTRDPQPSKANPPQ